jgi:peptidoglycan/LPS O-acetylase OafA/YrhL
MSVSVNPSLEQLNVKSSQADLIQPAPESLAKPAPKPTVQRARVVKALSGLRGCAALSVVLLHFNWDYGKTFLAGNYALNELGHVAVTFFFVLSAFLLTYRGVKEPRHNHQVKYWTIRNKRIPVFSMRWCAYFIRRIFRIYPCYILALGIACLVPRYRGLYYDYRHSSESQEGVLTWEHFLKYLVLWDVNSIFWTIPPEVEFYFILPLILVLYEKAENADFESGAAVRAAASGDGDVKAPEFKLTRVFLRLCHLVGFSIVAWVLVPLGKYYQLTSNQYHVYFAFHTFWVGTMLGILLHMAEQFGVGSYEGLFRKDKKNDKERETSEEEPSFKRYVLKKLRGILKKAVPLLCDVGCWVILAYTILSFPYYQIHYFSNKSIPDHDVDPNWYTRQVAGKADFVCALLIFLVCFGPQDSTFSRFFQWSALMWSGDVSFAIYLLHPVAIWEVANAPILGLDGAASIFLLSTLIATVVHYVVEKPGMKVGNWIIGKLRRRYFAKTPRVNANCQQPRSP